MIRHIHMHRILVQAGEEGFLEEVASELGLAGLGAGRGESLGGTGETFLADGVQQAEEAPRVHEGEG